MPKYNTLKYICYYLFFSAKRRQRNDRWRQIGGLLFGRFYTHFFHLLQESGAVETEKLRCLALDSP
jgi:hypothetical protein